MADIIIANTSGTETSSPFSVYPEDIPATIQIFNGSGTDSAKVQRSYDGSETENTFEDYKIDATIVVIEEAQTNIKAIDATGVFRMVKTTAGAAGVSLSKGRNL